MRVKLKFLKYLLFVMTLFLISRVSTVSAAEQEDIKNVLILNSYHQGLSWTNDQTVGMMEVLKKSNNNIDVLVEYMDWKNNPSDVNLSLLHNYYKFKYANKKIDLVMATDDAALQFALNNREELFSNAPVVFSGVNAESAKKITQGYEKVTGVLEEFYPEQTIAMALKINTTIKNVYLIYDNTESGLTMGNEAVRKIHSNYPELNLIPMNQMTFNEIIHTVKNLDSDSIVLMTTYSNDIRQKIYEMDYVIREVCANSSVPVYHEYDFGLNNGVLGGVMLSGKLQGESAANLAVRVLLGEDANRIPYMIPESTMSVIDYKQMKHFGITKNQVPRGFEVINKPFSFFDTYRNLVLSVIGIILVLIVFINFLLFHIRRINKMKKELSESHEELTQLYEELTASDEEMRQQYDEILSINEKIRIGEDKLAYLAYHDMLTGLPNKVMLYENAGSILCPDCGKVALLFVDVDNFKYVNDSLGHAFGDLLIKVISEKITKLFDNNENVYRLSGDEFVILLPNIEDVKEAQIGADKILQQFSQEINIQESVLRIGVSIGIAMYPEHGNRLEQLLKYADIAMYKVKENGKKNHMLYDSLMSDVFNERVNIEKYLQNALENNEFELHYQPQIDPEQNKIVGFEALLRWNSPELGRVSPIKFIKVAEDTRYIIPLGTWVIQTACKFIKDIINMGFDDLYISINISILQLLQSDFCELLFDTLKQLDLDPKYLELEITESILMESVDNIERDLQKLSDHNIRIALDDFGKGYSSLSYLSQLPITTLKVDKSFVDCIEYESESALTGHIVTLGKSMGMSVVAEGVEKKEQLDYLMQYKCDKIQGYYFSKPLQGKDLIELLNHPDQLPPFNISN